MPEVTILVVDDDPVILRLLEFNFEMEGYNVLTATDGQEGLERAMADGPDVIVSDIMMPRMNGFELVERLHANEATQSLPVILLSAKAQASEVQRGLDIGAYDYITKPFDPLELVERVAEAVTKAREG